MWMNGLQVVGMDIAKSVDFSTTETLELTGDAMAMLYAGESEAAFVGYWRKTTWRESEVTVAACALNGVPVTLVSGRPVQPRGTRCSVAAPVARATSSPSPWVGETV